MKIDVTFIAKALSIVEDLSNSKEPIDYENCMSYDQCALCKGQSPPNRWKIVHINDCPWKRARLLFEKEIG